MMPQGIDKDKRKFLEKIAHTCPVHKSLNPDMKLQIEIKYPD
jgi:uncharacterized OsmC-like protein